MSFIKFNTSNIASFSNGESAYIVGKNGFNSELGVVPSLVTAATLTDAGSMIQFTVRGLNTLYDYNTNTHILNNNTFSATKQVAFRVFSPDDILEVDQVSYVDPFEFISANIESFSLSTNTIKISNKTTAGTALVDKLESVPFYIKLFQPLATNNFTDKSMYVAGSTHNLVKYFNLKNQSGTYTADLVRKPEDKIFISVFLDGTKQSQGSFSWDNRANISLVISNSYSNLKVLYKIYTVPAIELGDNLFVLYNNTYSVINSTYAAGTAKANSILTNNNFFKIYLKDNINVNCTSFATTNATLDPYGVIGNVKSSDNTFTFDYNENIYPGLFNLANNYVYRLIKSNKFTPLSLVDGRTLYNVPEGPVSIRARNINSVGRKSGYATQTVIVKSLALPAVTSIDVTESLYLDTTQGVAVRVTISFDHITDSEILGYEISYKIEGESTDLSTFNTVQVPSTGVGDDGKIRYTINNVDRGRTSGVNYLVVKVTPINNDLDGIEKEFIYTIIGKSEAPENVTHFSSAQNGNILTLLWSFLMNNDDTLHDIDLLEVEIRRYSGTLDASQYVTAWNLATYVDTVGIPTTRLNLIIDTYGTYTYLIRTRDTSRNQSNDVMGLTIDLQRPTNLSAYKVWSEDDPSANDEVVAITNTNYAEYYWPSFSNSDNGGLYYAIDDPVTPGLGPSTLIENANGTTSGFSVSSNPSDLTVTANAFYQTAVRDLEQEVTGRITMTVNVSSILSTTWLAMKEDLISGVSTAGTRANVLWAPGSYIGSQLQSNSAIYDSVNRTLISPDSYGNVYAIWNSGQFTNDVSNANSFALIAGVINAHAVELSYTFFASGVPTLSNNLSNLTQRSSSYRLVNLKQWGDPEGLGNWQGADSLIQYNVELRYSTDNVYFSGSNANVNILAFTSSDTGSFDTYNSGDINFRWFQLKLNIINSNPSLATGLLDKFRYTVDLQDKTYVAAIVVTSNPTYVNLLSQGFRATPVVNLTPIIDSPLRINNTFPSYSSVESNATQANITVYDNTGTFISGTTVNFSAKGY